MRDKLIELIRIASHELTSRCVGDCGDCADKIADHLLENGVIVPPCKVGDKIYRIVGDNSILAWDIISMECFVDEIGFVDDSDNWIGFDDFGKTVFLTKEEAEKALKGVEQK